MSTLLCLCVIFLAAVIIFCLFRRFYSRGNSRERQWGDDQEEMAEGEDSEEYREPDPVLFYQSGFACVSPTVLLFIRGFFALYCVVTIVYAAVEGAYSFAFFTIWNFTLLCLYFLLVTFISYEVYRYARTRKYSACIGSYNDLIRLLLTINFCANHL